MEVITDGDDGDDGGMVNVESAANNNKQLAIGAPSLKIPASLGRETQRRLSFNLGGGTVEEQHIGNELCISSVRNGNISTASVIGEDGRYVNLALPTSHSTEMNIECTTTNQKTGEVTTVHSENDGVAGKITSRRLMVNNGCAQKSFQPGWYDHTTNFWHDSCGRSIDTTSYQEYTIFDMILEKYTSNSCPNLSQREGDIWISLIGDSVNRGIFLNGVLQFKELKEKYAEMLTTYQTWDAYGGIAPITLEENNFGNHMPFILAGLKVSPSLTVWITYTFTYLNPSSADGLEAKVPSTWHDFMQLRGEGPREDDPSFSLETVPGQIVFNPGYHSSHVNANQFGYNVNKVMNHFSAKQEETGVHTPVHVTLNVVPEPALIPDKHALDRPKRTVLNEYRKNLSIIRSVQRYDFVNSILDFFSPELIFNDVAHRDAVHLGKEMGQRVNVIAGALIVDAVCNSEEKKADDAQVLSTRTTSVV